MKRLCAFLAVVLFLVGVILLPAVHGLEIDHAGSDGHSESHSPESCAVCAVAAISMISVSEYVLIAPEAEFVQMISLHEVVPNSLVIISNQMARAPPFA
ncbi:MAG: hypothetical protein KAH23_04875 [Kiritimatiellae bacterium]|nr:hypothetical protein [Kiritimatiellia bacterium]